MPPICTSADFSRATRGRLRSGVTLIELTIATAVVTIILSGLAALVMTVEASNRYSNGRSAAVQHAQVAIGRMERAIHAAHANENFPGLLAFSEQAATYSFPDTLVVWKPSGAASDPDGLPLWGELVVFCPDPSDPRRLLEITDPTNNQSVPALADTAAWASALSALKIDPDANQVQLTDLLRTCEVDGSTTRAALRFHVVLRPSNSDWENYQSGGNWEDLPWVQDIYGSQMGLRQVWCGFEIQLMPGQLAALDDPNGDTSLPFFGSAALYYTLKK